MFVDHAVAKEPFDQSNPVTSGLQHLVFIHPGWIGPTSDPNLRCDVLVRTGERPLTVKVDDDLFIPVPTDRGFAKMLNPGRDLTPQSSPRMLAVQIRDKASDKPAGKEPSGAASPGAAAGGLGSKKLDVILVANLDVLGPIFFRLREASADDDEEHYDFDNVTFVLNVLDYLAGDDRFLEIRKRRPAHRTLERIGEATQQARLQAQESDKKARDANKEALDAVKANVAKQLANLKKLYADKKVGSNEFSQQLAMLQRNNSEKLRSEQERIERQQNKEEEQTKRELQQQIRGVQDRYKWWAVLLPPVPPLIVGVVVFAVRRFREREGVSRRRLR